MPPESNVESTLVWYKKDSESNMKYWVDELDAQLKRKWAMPTGNFLRNVNLYSKWATPFSPLAAYHDDTNSEYREDCSFDKPASEGKSCKVDASQWHPCTSSNKYNFQKGAPCIFLKLNKVCHIKYRAPL